jgi:hypothetical protein
MQAKFTLLLLLLAFGITVSLSAQVICLPGFPADSPVQSFSPDDIPSTNDHILTYTGAHAAGRANHTMSFVQIGSNEQKVWFFTDNASLDHEHVYYNRRYRADSSSPWYWQFSTSPAVLPYGAAADVVLYSQIPKYEDTRTGTLYSYIMYQVIQPPACFPGNTSQPSLGYMYVAFSNDGICWTANQLATRLGGPFAACIGASNTVPVEAVTAFDDGIGVKLIGMEGDILLLSDGQNMDQTQTYIGGASYLNPSNVGLYSAPMVVNSGIYSPVGVFEPYPYYLYSYAWRYEPYLYFMNMQGAYDPATGDLYVGRAYPYPFDRGQTNGSDYLYFATPKWWQTQDVFMTDPATGRSVLVGGCKVSPGTLPNRIQLYKMHIGSMSNFGALGVAGNYWTLLSDLGNASGYLNDFAAMTPLTYGQANAGRDYASVSFLRNGQGNLVRGDDGNATVFAGDTFELSKSNGPCQVTGLERETALQVP